MAKEKDIVYEKRVLAFVDILGFKTLIDDSKDNIEEQKRIKNAMDIIHGYKVLNDTLYTPKEKEDENGGLRGLGIQVTTFSDSAVMSYPLSYDGALFALIVDLIHMQMDLLWHHVLIRGSIVIGDAYHDSNNVFGPAMVEAYQMESKCALYPRIIIHPDTIKKGLEYSPSHLNDYDIKSFDRLVNWDIDGFFYINFLTQFQEFDYPEISYYSWLKFVRKTIVDGLNRYQGCPDIFVKYRWLMQYWNKTLKDDNFFIPEADVDNIERSIEEYRALTIDSKKEPFE